MALLTIGKSLGVAGMAADSDMEEIGTGEAVGVFSSANRLYEVDLRRARG